MTIQDILPTVPEPPCNDCKNKLQCQKEKLACLDFFNYIKYGKVLKGQTRRTPSSAWYVKAMAE